MLESVGLPTVAVIEELLITDCELSHRTYEPNSHRVGRRLTFAHRFCSETGYVSATAAAKRIIEGHEHGWYASSDGMLQMQRDIRQLRRQIIDEVQGRYYLHLTTEESRLYTAKQPFGNEIENAFPSATKDIRAAAKCLSVGMNTACVLHLMRALEIVIKKCVLTALHATPQATLTWSDLANKIRQKINSGGAIPGIIWDADARFFGRVASDLDGMRVAWRNDSVHANEHYDRQEAEAIFKLSNAFLRRIAARLNE